MADFVAGPAAPTEVKPDVPRKIAIVGEIPFSGRALAKAITEAGLIARVLCPDSAAESALTTLPRREGIEIVPGDLGNPTAVASALGGAYGVCFVSPITLAGRIYRAAEHIDDVRTVVQACETHALRKVMYHSAVGANVGAQSRALQDAAAAEELIGNSRCEDFRIRTGMLMGRGDGFLSEIVKQASGGAPFMSVWGYGDLLLQPILAEDFGCCVAQLFTPASDSMRNGVYAVVGPEMVSLLQLTDAALDLLKRKKLKFHVPLFVLQLEASMSRNAKFKERVGLLFGAFAVDQNDAPKLMGANAKLTAPLEVQRQLVPQ